MYKSIEDIPEEKYLETLLNELDDEDDEDEEEDDADDDTNFNDDDI